MCKSTRIAPGYIATDTAALRADLVRKPAIPARIPAGTMAAAKDLADAALPG